MIKPRPVGKSTSKLQLTDDNTRAYYNFVREMNNVIHPGSHPSNLG